MAVVKTFVIENPLIDCKTLPPQMLPPELRQWRVVLYFECLTDFSLLSLAKEVPKPQPKYFLAEEDFSHPPTEQNFEQLLMSMPNAFYMHVTFLQQTFTLELETEVF